MRFLKKHRLERPSRVAGAILTGMLIMFILNMTAAEEMVEVPRSELEEYLARMEKDEQTITELRQEKYQLMTEVSSLEAENGALEVEVERLRTGLFVGANVGYPWGGNALILYKLGKYGVYSLVGYHRAFHIDIGIMGRIK